MERPTKSPLVVVAVEYRDDEEGAWSLWLTVDQTVERHGDGWTSKRVVDKQITLHD